MGEENISKRLISLVEELNGNNVHQTICSFYDLHTQFNSEIINAFVEHFDQTYPLKEDLGKLSPQQYLALSLPLIMYQFDNNLLAENRELIPKVIQIMEAHEMLRQYDRLYSKIYFFYSITSENPLELLLSAYRRSCDSHLHQTQSTIVNCLLKYYISTGGYSLALSFLKHCSFPNDASPSQLGRYHYFVGHLKAVALEYAESQHHLQLSLRRLPQNRYSDPFRSLVVRHLVVVMMLQGQVPTRSMLLDHPIYLDLARSILKGDVISFQEVVKNPQFEIDGLEPLVQRLRSSVILAGLTMISHCYSRITFSDIADMLHIGSAEDACGFCAKAAADGIIDAVIDLKSGCLISMNSKDDINVGFSDRINKDIQDCFSIREDAQRIMHEEVVQE
ncbi:26S proteasome regulatory subunit S3 [Histomonas meleagridis]|uniref:26S proteasome regulatory subunit S3 n=1 Tax=Histomonas meleagridis TaxID=135588 RepID=UPI00355A0754|nr:26S proteasome regulatory subunit S3 [Histomonas meleagridis]KAH0800660.1 26S proteasome regulatory subunit S3 [Histomonas meleagridis]